MDDEKLIFGEKLLLKAETKICEKPSEKVQKFAEAKYKQFVELFPDKNGKTTRKVSRAKFHLSLSSHYKAFFGGIRSARNCFLLGFDVEQRKCSRVIFRNLAPTRPTLEGEHKKDFSLCGIVLYVRKRSFRIFHTAFCVFSFLFHFVF